MDYGTQVGRNYFLVFVYIVWSEVSDCALVTADVWK